MNLRLKTQRRIAKASDQRGREKFRLRFPMAASSVVRASGIDMRASFGFHRFGFRVAGPAESA